MINPSSGTKREYPLLFLLLGIIVGVAVCRYVMLRIANYDNKPRLSLNGNRGTVEYVQLKYTLPKNVKIATNIIQPQMPPRIYRSGYPVPPQYTSGFEEYLETPLLSDVMFPNPSSTVVTPKNNFLKFFVLNSFVSDLTSCSVILEYQM